MNSIHQEITDKIIAMMEKGISPLVSEEFVETLNTCEFARFAPGDASQHMQTIYNKALDMIAALS